jgi:GDP-L-fucose synthase
VNEFGELQFNQGGGFGNVSDVEGCWVVRKMTNYWQNRTVLIAGGSGFVGTHLTTKLNELGCIPINPSSLIYDFRRYDDTAAMFRDVGKIDVLFNLAANVGGIGYNQAHGYDLYYDNLQICTNLIHHAKNGNVGKFVQIGTVCAYPKYTTVPFDERTIWDGYPEETNAPYGLAKRMALLHLQLARKDFGLNGIYLLPTNLYGPGDNFNPEQSHVIPALIKKFIDARIDNLDTVEIWGTGNASRDFLFISDAIRGIMLLAEKYDRPEPVNLGSGNEIRIDVIVEHLKELAGYKGKIKYNSDKPDGQPRRGLRIWTAKELGWLPEISLKDGLRQTISWYEASI